MSDTFTDLMAALRGIPDLPQAACKGRHELFDEPHPGEHDDDLTYRHQRALDLCTTCPALDDCRTWLNSLRPAQRPIGVIAGQIRTPREAAA